MTTLHDDLEQMIELTLQRLAVERRKYAVEPEAMFDYIDFDSTRLYRPTLSHLWYLLFLDECCTFDSQSDRFVNSVYALTFTPDAVRNKLFRQMRLHKDVLTQRAKKFCDAHEDILAAGALLLDDLKGDEDGEDDADDSLELGWYANIVGVLAAEYSWTEQEVFSLPVVRLRSYLKRLGAFKRTFPELPAEKELQRLMKLKMEILKNGGEKS